MDKVYAIGEGAISFDVDGKAIVVVVSHGGVYVSVPGKSVCSNPDKLLTVPFFDVEPGCEFIGHYVDLPKPAARLREKHRYDLWRHVENDVIVARYGFSAEDYIDSKRQPDNKIINAAKDRLNSSSVSQ